MVLLVGKVVYKFIRIHGKPNSIPNRVRTALQVNSSCVAVNHSRSLGKRAVYCCSHCSLARACAVEIFAMDDLENLLSDLNSTLGGNTTSSSKGSSSFSRPSHSQPSTTRLPVHEKAAARPSFSSEVWLEPYYTCTRLFDQKEYLENISRVGIGVVTPANAIWNRLLLVGRPRSPSQILEVGDIEALRRIVFHISRYNVVSFKRRSRFPEARVGRCCTAYTRRLGLVVERPEPDFNQQGTLKSPVSLLGALLASQIIQGM